MQVSVRVELGEGAVNVATGLPVLDHLVGELARTARMQLTLEVAPGRRGPGGRRGGPRARGGHRAAAPRAAAPPAAAWRGFRPTRRSRARCSRCRERPLVASNVDFSGQRVGGLGERRRRRFLKELAAGAGLNVHIRVLEGKDPQNVLRAIFKALGAAIGQACRTPEGGEPHEQGRSSAPRTAPAPFQGAPYNQAIVANGFVFVAGPARARPGDQGDRRRRDRAADRAGVREPAARSSRRPARRSTRS